MIVEEKQPERISFLLDNLTGGGAEKVILNLARGFSKLGYPVDILVCKVEGVLCNSIPAGVNLVPLKPVSALRGLWCALQADPMGSRAVLAAMINSHKVPKGFKFIPAIAEHLKSSRPDILLSALPKSNINAVLAKYYAGASTRVVVGAHINISTQCAEGQRHGKTRIHDLRPVMKRCYRRAHAVVAVSRGVQLDTVRYLGLDADQVRTIYNPIQTPEMEAMGREPVDHPWFTRAAAPVVLGVGRFVDQKDFPLLLRAFARVRQHREVRLMLLGGNEVSGEQCENQAKLVQLANELGIQDDFDMPGFKVNPYPYLRESAVFVLSSRYEGFGNVLVEAMLTGCSVVSTDCPSGPAEILRNGEFGHMVPVNDEVRLADAICQALDNPDNKDILRARGRVFSVERAVESYRQVFFGSSTPDGLDQDVIQLDEKRKALAQSAAAPQAAPREARK